MKLHIELGKPSVSGECKTYILIGACKDKQRIPTNIFLGKGEYRKTKNGLKILNFQKEFAINKILLELQTDMMNNTALALAGKEIKASQVKSALMDKMISSDFFIFCDDWLSTCTLKGKKNYVTAVNSFRSFIGKDILTFAEITPSLLKRYQNSLKNRERAQSMYMAALRKLWNEAERIYDDEIPRSPFRKIDIVKQKPVGQRATDIETIHKIFEYDGNERRAVLARDCFILSFCLMGMNSVDLYKCKELKDNGTVISYNRSKVADRRRDKGHTEVRIHPFVQEIFKKYHHGRFHIFNFYSMYSSFSDFNRALNLGLKTILGRNSKVTYYSARHTWATIARNDIGADKGTVNDALVHVDPQMAITDLYIRKDFRLINELNTKVIDYVFGKYM